MRTVLKKTVFMLALGLVSPFIAASWIEKRLSDCELIFTGIGQFLSVFPGLIGSYCRAAYYFGSLEKCSWEVHIGFGSFFTHRTASLGRHVAIGAYGVIGTAAIEEGTMIASRVSITSGKRQHLDDDFKFIPKPRFDKVRIGQKTWIGEGAIIMANVGNGCIVSAGTVVVHDIPDGQIIAGNPGKPIKKSFHSVKNPSSTINNA